MADPLETESLKAFRDQLLEAHRTLLAALRQDHERMSGSGLRPAEWFQILISSPTYQWLKPLNTLLADIDALFEAVPVSEMDLAVLRHSVDSLFFTDNDEIRSFNYHYRGLLQHHPEIVVIHGRLKQAISLLPKQSPPSNLDDIRRGWHKMSSGKSKKNLLN